MQGQLTEKKKRASADKSQTGCRAGERGGGPLATPQEWMVNEEEPYASTECRGGEGRLRRCVKGKEGLIGLDNTLPSRRGRSGGRSGCQSYAQLLYVRKS